MSKLTPEAAATNTRLDEMDDRPRGRGRPRATSPATISELAFALMRERGYSATTMADIAAEAGISTPTLFRYFDSKAAVLWFGMDDSARLFRSAFAAIDAEVPLVDAVFAAYLEMLRASAERLPLIKARIAVVERDPDAGAATWGRYEEWGRMVSEFVAERRGIDPSSLEATVLGNMIWAALQTAISSWAVSVDDDPSTVVNSARALLREQILG